MMDNEFYNVTKVSINIELSDESDLDKLYKIMAELKSVKGVSSYTENITTETKTKNLYYLSGVYVPPKAPPMRGLLAFKDVQ